jgi:hypothetical protein
MNKIIYDINVDNKFESINYRNSIKKTKGKITMAKFRRASGPGSHHIKTAGINNPP